MHDLTALSLGPSRRPESASANLVLNVALPRNLHPLATSPTKKLCDSSVSGTAALDSYVRTRAGSGIAFEGL